VPPWPGPYRSELRAVEFLGRVLAS